MSSGKDQHPNPLVGVVRATICRHGRWWRGVGYQHWICEVCHPPAYEHLVAERRAEQ